MCCSSLILAIAAWGTPSEPRAESLISQQGSEILQPQTYWSPSGQYSLFVDPGGRRGGGPGIYTVAHLGTQVWIATHAFTLWEAGITDDGVAFGYGYQGGINGVGAERLFHVAIFSAGGDLLIDDVVPRTKGNRMHATPGPFALGLIELPSRRRFLVRVVDPDVNGRLEERWIYDLVEGSKVASIEPRKHLPIEQDSWRTVQIKSVEPLPNLPLILVRWWLSGSHSDPASGYEVEGSLFALVDDWGESVWTHSLPGKQTMRGDQTPNEELEHPIRRDGRILQVGDDGQFWLWFKHEDARVEHRVRWMPSTSEWQVIELSRSGYIPPTRRPAVEESFASLDLHQISSVPLRTEELAKQADMPVKSEVSKRQLLSRRAEIDHLGRVILLQQYTRTIQVFDSHGSMIYACDPRTRQFGGTPSLGRIVVDRDGLIHAQVGRRGTEYIPFDRTGTRMSRQDSGGRFLEFHPDGESSWISHSNYRNRGIHLQKDEVRTSEIERTANGRWFIYITDLAVDSSGNVAILDSGRSLRGPVERPSLSLFDSSGAALDFARLPHCADDQVELCEGWAVVASYGSPAWLFRRSDHTLSRFDLPQGDENTRWEFGFSPDGTELWCVEITGPTLHRFALPK